MEASALQSPFKVRLFCISLQAMKSEKIVVKIPGSYFVPLGYQLPGEINLIILIENFYEQLRVKFFRLI